MARGWWTSFVGTVWVICAAAVHAEARSADGGGGEVAKPPSLCLTAERRAEIQAQLAERLREPRFADRPRAESALGVSLLWPTAPSGIDDPGTHTIANFVDQDATFGALLDYNCGQRTYDIPGYNHAGIDISTWPFPWYRMSLSQVVIKATAAGTILDKSDGHFDRRCMFNNDDWNAVYILHDDGSIAWYGHMKRGSQTTKAIGERVAAGERLGVVGSSGSSTGPHLHLELYDAAGNLTDAYAGPCNGFASSTSWAAQRPYVDSAINEVATHHAAPFFPTSCPTTETPNYRDVFAPGATAYFAAYYRDQVQGQLSTYTILQPDGTVWKTWTDALTAAPFYASSYWYYVETLPSAPLGTWTFRVEFEGQTADHAFVVGAVPSLTIADASVREGQSGTRPLTFSLTLSAPLALSSTVNYTTIDGTAAAGSDYAAQTGFVTFAAGETSQTVSIPVNGDLAMESDETFTVRLSGPTGATLARTQAVGTIVDDDPVPPPLVPQYRLFNGVTGEHLYTTDPHEYDVLGSGGWSQEGVADRLFSASGIFAGVDTVPLFRLFEPALGQHHWTTDAHEVDVLSSSGWLYEGITGHVLPSGPSAPPGTTALYRLYHVAPPQHLWTTDAHEYEVLGDDGWSREGIVGYVVP
jgi:murein DD-endopeptidase MepM/ murein hydrolase activator NlpD